MFINLYAQICTLCANKMFNIKLNYAAHVNNNVFLITVYV